MKYPLLILAILGIIVSSLALREHYREYGDSPCSINEHWDCGVVNHSRFAMLGPIPVATVGIIGYVLMAVLALMRSYRLLIIPTFAGLAFSLYLANIEAHILQVWCVYCVASLVIISLMCLLDLGVVVAGFFRKPSAA
ncbi:MAG TPA: vitamin K epoxide reductase family protein [Candidatus Sulfotelmatobacter sp.]|nr:vitamin K epoxide reductase family protein [Candidatus Sulfotelmatobacter sp.]